MPEKGDEKGLKVIHLQNYNEIAIKKEQTSFQGLILRENMHIPPVHGIGTDWKLYTKRNGTLERSL